MTAHLKPNFAWQDWIRQLSAALVYDGIGTRDPSIGWDEALVFTPELVGSDSNLSVSRTNAEKFLKKQQLQETLDKRSWVDGWLVTPQYPRKIYAFQLNIEPKHVILKHTFYSYFRLYVEFNASLETTNSLLQREIEFLERYIEA